MSDISPVGSGPGVSALVHPPSLNGHLNGVAGNATGVGGLPVGRLDPPPSQRLADIVEVSDRALYLQSIMGVAPVRQEVVVAARELIQRDEYPSEEQMQIAIDRMIAEWQTDS